MPKTRINCPNCRQPVTAEIETLFDVSADPSAKQRLLSGATNIIQCPNCGYQGSLAVPIVYHDADKELLLTFFPPDVNQTREEQERTIGPLINQVVTRLPQEKRKGYLFRPQTVLTMQGLAERILEADGITREMMQAQQQRLNLLQRLLTSPDEVIVEIAQQEDQLMDADFFNLLNRLAETAAAQGDRESAQRLSDIQKILLPVTTVGRQLQEQSQEVEAAIRSLQEAGRNLTREKLLELVIEAPNETRLGVLTSFARAGMDYSFFQLLSDRIDKAKDPERQRLVELRENLLEMTQEIDHQVEERAAQTRELLEAILAEEDIVGATQQSLPIIDEFFVRVLNEELAAARQKGELDKLENLNKIVGVLQQASAPPPELALIEEFLDAENEQERRAWLEAHNQEITPEFLETLTALMAQTQGNDQELYHRLQASYRSALRYSMEANIKK